MCPPMSNPLLNEMPYITTEARLVFIHHSFPSTTPGLGLPGGGNANSLTLQLRIALTERLGFIANKDGYADVDFNAPGLSDDGFANIAFGFKYALYSNPENETLVTADWTSQGWIFLVAGQWRRVHHPIYLGCEYLR